MVEQYRKNLHYSEMRVLLAIHPVIWYTDNGVATEGWREASELNKKIDDLYSRARSIGWSYWQDPEFQELYNNVFNRADGPSSVIAHLEGVLDSAKVPHGISNQSAAGETQGTLLVREGEADGSFEGLEGKPF